MRVLLDENLPHKLRAHLSEHETVTVSYLGWGGLKNGELLAKAEESGIDVLVTGDRAMEYQQRVEGKKIAVVALSANNWPIIRDHVDAIVTAVGAAVPGTMTRVQCGSFARRHRRG